MPTQDQGSCGSCYAFASAAMLSERLCIQKNAKPNYLSTQYILSCDGLDFGCKGGHIENTISFLNEPIPPESLFKY